MVEETTKPPRSICARRGTIKGTMLQALLDKEYGLFETLGNFNLFYEIGKELHIWDGSLLNEGKMVRKLIDCQLQENEVIFIVPERDTFDAVSHVE